MLAVATETLQAVNIAVLALGGAVVVAFAVWLLRSGRWRNPLSGRQPPRIANPWVAVLGVLLAFFLIFQVAGLLLLPRDADPKEIERPGSHLFHQVQVAESLAKLSAIAVMVVLLLRAPTAMRNPDGVHAAWRTLISAAVLGALATTALTLLELYAAKTVWRWWQPDAPQPLHSALLALKDSAWNVPGGVPWGTIQLCIGAVLLAPIAEELFFRGFLLGALYDSLRHSWLAILITGVLFGWIHQSQPQDVLPLAVMGVALGFLRVRYASLGVCIVVHALFNAYNITLAILAPELITS